MKVKLYLGPLAGELAAELPFTLMHPKVHHHHHHPAIFTDIFIVRDSGITISYNFYESMIAIATLIKW